MREVVIQRWWRAVRLGGITQRKPKPVHQVFVRHELNDRHQLRLANGQLEPSHLIVCHSVGSKR